MNDYYQTINPLPLMSEPFSCLSHLIGAIVFAIAGVILVRRGRGAWHRQISLAVFAAASVGLLLTSGLYHLADRDSMAREVLVRLDHAAIFILIAASFTPLHTIHFRGPGRWGMLLVVWAAAIVSLIMKVIFFEQIPDSIGIAMYLALGWLGAVSGLLLARKFGFGCVRPLLWGGLAYTLGAMIEFNHGLVVIPGVIEAHDVFHLAVLLGLASHWSLAFRIADGTEPHLRKRLIRPEWSISAGGRRGHAPRS